MLEVAGLAVDGDVVEAYGGVVDEADEGADADDAGAGGDVEFEVGEFDACVAVAGEGEVCEDDGGDAAGDDGGFPVIVVSHGHAEVCGAGDRTLRAAAYIASYCGGHSGGDRNSAGAGQSAADTL